MEPAVRLPRYVFFDLSGAGLRCFSPVPAVEHTGVLFDAKAMGLEALHRTRLSRADLATHRPVRAGTAMTNCDQAQLGDPDTMSDAGTSCVQLPEENDGDESGDKVDSLDELFFQESFARKIDALAELVGMTGTYEPAAVLGEVVRVLQEIDRKRACSVCATRAV